MNFSPLCSLASPLSGQAIIFVRIPPRLYSSLFFFTMRRFIFVGLYRSFTPRRVDSSHRGTDAVIVIWTAPIISR